VPSSTDQRFLNMSLQPAALPRLERAPPGVELPAHRLGLPVLRGAWRRLLPRWIAWPFPLLVLLLWQLGAEYEWIAPQVLPSPAAVWATLLDLFRTGEIWGHLQVSLVRVFAGFALGLTVGGTLGVAMGLSSTFKDYVYPLFKAFSQVPVLGWLPLLMLLVGIDEALKILLISKAALVPIALNTRPRPKDQSASVFSMSATIRSSGDNPHVASKFSASMRCNSSFPPD
jgi:sulfonate transport system permease protein